MDKDLSINLKNDKGKNQKNENEKKKEMNDKDLITTILDPFISFNEESEKVKEFRQYLIMSILSLYEAGLEDYNLEQHLENYKKINLLK